MTKKHVAAAAGANSLPPRLRRHISLVVLSGMVTLGLALPPTLDTSLPIGAAVLVAAFFIVGDLALINIRFGHNNYSFTWSELAVVFGLVLVPSAWLVVVAVVAVAAAQAITRRPLAKLMFNSTASATGVGLARMVCVTFGPSNPGPLLHRPQTWVVLALASLTFMIWNSVTVGMAVAFSQRLSIVSVLRKGALLQGIVWFGNTVVGIGFALVARETAVALVVLPFFLGALYFAYFAYLRLAEDRNSWQVLQDTSGELARLARAEIAVVVLERTQNLFRAEFVELLLLDPGAGVSATTWTSTDGDPVVRLGVPVSEARTYWPRARSEREMFEIRRESAPPVQARELETLGLKVCLVLPLTAADECLGALRIGFGGPVKVNKRERQVLRTFGNQVAVSVQNARLFEQMREERAKLRRVIDHTSDGILSVDSQGHTTSWNPVMMQMTGLPEHEVLGAPFTLGRAAVADDGSAVGVSWLWDLLGDDASAQTQVIIGRSRGDERRLALSASAVRRDDGALDALVLVARDVTAMHKASQAKEAFLATVSHELRTPLTTLDGWLRTLRRPDFSPSPDDQRQIFDSMARSTLRLNRLVEDLLNINELDGGSITIESVSLAVDDVIDKALTDFAREHPDRLISRDRAGLVGRVVADPTRLAQVVVHLLSNAHKFSPAGAPITVGLTRDADTVTIVVSDRCCGIPEDQLGAVFERFHRLGDYMTRAQQQGTGVGLHIARQLVEAMKGKIWATSTLGLGSQFHVTLPAAPPLARTELGVIDA